jgi:hypothetical protein
MPPIQADGNVRNYVIKPAVQGVVCAAAAAMTPGLAGVSVRIPTYGDVSLPIFMGVAGFLAGEVTQLMNAYVMPHIPVVSAFSHPAHAALNAGTAAATLGAALEFEAPGAVSDLGIAKLAIYGVVSEVGSSYLTDEILIPTWNQWSS